MKLAPRIFFLAHEKQDAEDESYERQTDSVHMLVMAMGQHLFDLEIRLVWRHWSLPVGNNHKIAAMVNVFRAQEPKAPVTYCDHALSGVR